MKTRRGGEKMYQQKRREECVGCEVKWIRTSICHHRISFRHGNDVFFRALALDSSPRVR